MRTNSSDFPVPHLFLRTPITRHHTYPFSKAETYSPTDNDISSSIDSLPSTHIGDNSDASESPEYEYVESGSDEEDEEESSEEIDLEFMVTPPFRPLETGDSYFPLQPLHPPTLYPSPPPSFFRLHGNGRLVTLSDSEDDIAAESSNESVVGDDADDALDLMYPPTPPPTRPPLAWRHISRRHISPEPDALLPRGLSLSPLALLTALINLPHTTPIARTVPSLHIGTSLSNFAQAALSGAEKVLSGFKLMPALSTNVVLKEMEHHIAGLERSQQALSTPPLRGPSTKFPFTEVEDQQSIGLRYQYLPSTPSCYWGLLKGITIPAALHDTPIRSFQQASLTPRPSYTPASSPIYSPKPAATLEDDIFIRPRSPTDSITESEAEVISRIFDWDKYDDEEYRAAEDIVRQTEKQESLEGEFDDKRVREEQRIEQNTKQPIPIRPKSRWGYSDDKSTRSSTQSNILDKESVEEMELKDYAQYAEAEEIQMEEFRSDWDLPYRSNWYAKKIAAFEQKKKADQHPDIRSENPGGGSEGSSTNSHAMSTEQTLWGPSSRRPMCNELGHISFDRTKNGCVDYMFGNPPWPIAARRQDEVLGYALEFPDSAVLQAHVKFRTKLSSNLHQEQLLHTERRIRTEVEHHSRQRNSTRAVTPLSVNVYPQAYRRNTTPDSDHARLTEFTLAHRPEAHCFSPGYDYPQDFSSLGFPELPRMISRRVLEYEHVKRTQLAVIDRSARCRYEGYFAHAAASEENSFKDHDEQPTKRRKITAPPLGNQVVNAEAIKAILIDWQPYPAGLRDFRNDIFFTIQRLIEAIKYLDGRTEFRKIFFPFKEEFAVTTVRDMYDMECSLNPDGFSACATFFRATQNYELAFILEEILLMQFRDDMGMSTYQQQLEQLLQTICLLFAHDTLPRDLTQRFPADAIRAAFTTFTTWLSKTPMPGSSLPHWFPASTLPDHRSLISTQNEFLCDFDLQPSCTNAFTDNNAESWTWEPDCKLFD
ncbi:hypothetical protein B0H16DRAFT_1890096 [Mycena metata]|uniref:Uncharacterized protein n=1 Tax=Mycena metata TaxID=1033252 RepID=A0AAD7IIT0_9AGAR|nr:hypothetical protein B0H16DRAFT_1890096 [Mycena metata]